MSGVYCEKNWCAECWLIYEIVIKKTKYELERLLNDNVHLKHILLLKKFYGMLFI